MRTVGSILGIVLAGALGACSHQNTQSAGAQGQYQNQAQQQQYGQQQYGQGQAQTTAGTCPLAKLHGVHATVADTSDGVAITFTASQNDLDQLRQNVQAMVSSNDREGDAFAACPCARSAVSGSAEAMPGDQGQGGSYGTNQYGSGTSSSGQMNQGSMNQGSTNQGQGSMNQGATNQGSMNPQGSMSQGSMSPSGSPNQDSMGRSGMNQGSMDQGQQQAMLQMPASEAKVDEIPTGAILELRARDSSQIMTLRSAVKRNVHALRQACLTQNR
jgi:hypothetical protein